MIRILPLAALVAVVACRADFEPTPTGPGQPPPPPPPSAPAIPFRIGSIEPDEARAVTVNSFGDPVVASWFAGSVDFDPGAAATIRPTFGQQDVAVASYSPDGEFRWVYTHGGAGADIPFAITPTSGGGVVITGHSTGGGTCGGRTLVGLGGRDILVMKIDAAGLCAWAQLIGGPLDDEGRAVAVEAGGTVLVAGLFRGTVDFDPGSGATLLSSRGGSDAFLLRLTSDGELLDVEQGGGLGDEAFTAIAVAPDGEIAVGGHFNAEARYGSPLAPVILLPQSGIDGMLARYTPLLGLRWATHLGATGDVGVTALLEEPDGSLLATGQFEGVLDADPGTGAVLLQAEGGSDAFLVRYAGGSGVYASMAVRVGGPEGEAVTALARSPDGAMHLAGRFQGTVDFDPGAGAFLVTARGSAGGGDAFVLTLGPLGGFRWVTPIGGVVTGVDALTIAWGLTAAPDGTVWTVGRFAGRADFDPGLEAVDLQSQGATDQFVSRYAAGTGALAP